MPDYQTGLFAWCSDTDAIEAELDRMHLAPGPDGLNAVDFLHGHCDVFALALHDLYGYPIGMKIDDDACAEDPSDADAAMGYMTHVYCITTFPDGTEAFCDIRGMTPDAAWFFEPFEDFLTLPGMPCAQPSPEQLRANAIHFMGQTPFDTVYGLAMKAIQGNPWYALPEPAVKYFICREHHETGRAYETASGTNEMLDRVHSLSRSLDLEDNRIHVFDAADESPR